VTVGQQESYARLRRSQLEDVMGEVASPGALDSLSTFLKYGPAGLAALMLVLVVISLSLEINPQRERLLRQFMYVGAFCFVLTLIANYFSVAGAYQLYFRVIPLDAGANHILPPPIIRINSSMIDEQKAYLVKSDVTAVVDVTDAIEQAQQIRTENERQREALKGIATGSNSIIADLQKIPQIIDKNCNGGNSGVPAASNPAVLAVTSNAASTIAGFRSAALAVLSTELPGK
jgi:hypothetical protein